jgi:hypothetical protein
MSSQAFGAMPMVTSAVMKLFTAKLRDEMRCSDTADLAPKLRSIWQT